MRFWNFITRMFGIGIHVHDWGDYEYWYAEEPDASNDYGQDVQGIYVKCKTCPAKKVIQYPY